MALNSSGPISFGGATAGQSINLELQKASSDQISLNDQYVRVLGKRQSAGSTISAADCWGQPHAYIALDGGGWKLGNSQVAVGEDGSIYILDSNALTNFNKKGERQWRQYYWLFVSGQQQIFSHQRIASGPNQRLAVYGSIYENGVGWRTLINVYDSSTGILLWNGAPMDLVQWPGNIAFDATGNLYYVTKEEVVWSQGSITVLQQNIIVGKYSSTGTHLWRIRLGNPFQQIDSSTGSGHEYGLAIQVDSDGGIYIFGGQARFLYECNWSCTYRDRSHNPLLIKLNSSGQLLWSKYYGSLTPFAARLHYVSGSLRLSPNPSDPGIYVLAVVDKVDLYFIKIERSTGNILWQRKLNTVALNTGDQQQVNVKDSSITFASDGNPIIAFGNGLTGAVYSFGDPINANSFICKISSSNGSLLYAREMGISHIAGIAVANEKLYVVGGPPRPHSSLSGYGEPTYALTMIESDGRPTGSWSIGALYDLKFQAASVSFSASSLPVNNYSIGRTSLSVPALQYAVAYATSITWGTVAKTPINS